MKSVLGVSVVALGIAMLPVNVEAATKVKFVQDASYAPYMFVKEGQPAGIYKDILVEVDKRLKDYEFDIQALPWQRAVNYVESGKADGLLGTYHRPEARPWVQHFSKPLMTEEVAVFCRKGIAQSSWIYPDSFVGLKFGNNSGFKSPGEAFFKLVDAGQIKLEEAKDTETNLRKLNAGRIDCYVQDALNAKLAIHKLSLGNIEKAGSVTVEAGHIGFGGSIANSDFFKAMDDVLLEMSADGTIGKLVEKYQ